MDARDAIAVVMVGALAVVLLYAVVQVRSASVPPPAPVAPAENPAVKATLATLGSQLAPGGTAGWLVVALGSEHAAAEAIVSSLYPGLPEAGSFAVNRLVAQAPVRLTGEVKDGVASVSSVERLDQPDATTGSAELRS